MQTLTKLGKAFRFESFGNIAMASFVICIVSGIFLALPYDVEAAYDSIALILITNMPAVVFRNLHYWSAQFFLVFTLLHTLEQIKRRSQQELTTGPWMRLVASLFFVFFVMLSGFILKGDADSLQAYRIMESLLTRIPVAGQFMARLLLGEEDNFQLLYVHHIATASIFLVYVIFEHAKTLWTSRATFLVVLAITTILSFFIHAPLHDNLTTVLKGPWYFIGLQEIMHWTGHPGWIWILLFLLTGLVFITFLAGEKTSSILYRTLLILGVLYLGLVVTGYFFRGENWAWKSPWKGSTGKKTVTIETGFRKTSHKFSSLTALEIPVVRGRREACMVCHNPVSGFAPAHDPLAIGCTSCHLGNPFTLEKGTAHKHMILIPGNLENAAITCGSADCHPVIAGRIFSSLMTTNSGIVSVDRFVFGESSSPDALSHVASLGHGAADTHLRGLCANCHLGHKKIETGAVNQLSRGGGCTACHLNYSDVGLKQHEGYISKGRQEEGLPRIHPSLDIRISNDHCFGCHSRSGRIAPNYEGWHETLLDADTLADRRGYRVLQDERVFTFISADIHHAAGMDCIDCHNSYETMGDGVFYMHEENAVKTSCNDCHFKLSPTGITYRELDEESRKIFDLRKYDTTRRVLKSGKGGLAMVNAFLDGDSAFLVLKNSGRVLPLNPPASQCSNLHGHRGISCSSCHSAWAPSCIGCHNAFDPEASGFDLLESQSVKGEWIEYTGLFIADYPALGVRTGPEKKIEPAIPGMIITIDRSGFEPHGPGSSEEVIFHRLYAPAAPHTTSKKGRGCKSCHNNPAALGYGRGTLAYGIEGKSGKWSFSPRFAPSTFDGLPEDAWIGFLADLFGEKLQSTRTDFRPFSLPEQKRILTVGACLTCHEEDSRVMRESLNEEFPTYMKTVTEKCILPEW